MVAGYPLLLRCDAAFEFVVTKGMKSLRYKHHAKRAGASDSDPPHPALSNHPEKTSQTLIVSILLSFLVQDHMPNLSHMIANQTVHPNCLRCKPFLRRVRELSVGVREDEREQESLSEGNEESLPSEGG